MPATVDPSSQAALNMQLLQQGRLTQQTAFQTSLGGGGGTVPITSANIASAGLSATYAQPLFGTPPPITPPTPVTMAQVVPPPSVTTPEVTNAAAYSQSTLPPIAQGSSSTATITTGIPYLDTLQQYLNAHNIHLSKVQQKALEIGAGAVGAGLAAYGIYKAVKGKKHATRKTRRVSRSRHGVRRASSSHRTRSHSRKAHLVKGSIAAKRHMAKLRRMRKKG